MVNYKTRTSPYKLDLALNAQHAMHEARTIVYDSVGVGLGHYRYDEILNEYIRDQNGSYLAHTIFTGNYKSGNGGALAEIADVCIVCDTTSMERIEDLQLIINHIVKEAVKASRGLPSHS